MRVYALLLGCAAALAGLPAHAQSSAATTEAPVLDQSEVDPRAIDALRKMSTFLQTLETFRLTSEASLDVITVQDQKVQLDSVSTYLVKKPGIRIDWVSDQRNRQFY